MSEWDALRKYTQARIGVGRAGYAVPTSDHLKFQFDHAQARDAIHWPWDISEFKKKLGSAKIPALHLKSAVKDRIEYLKRPDLGRMLAAADRRRFKRKNSKFDVVIIISNGLSSSAVDKHGLKFLKRLLIDYKKLGLKIAPIVLIENARVAISDEIGALLGAKIAIIVLGERPGLTAFDSLAMYLTYSPRPGNSDAQRNCISNIRPPEGLSYEVAVKKGHFLILEALRRKLSGVDLKEETEPKRLPLI